MNLSEMNDIAVEPAEVVEPTEVIDQNLPDAPYGPKITSISNAGIEFYWKKVEIADGYEVLRSYTEDGVFEKIAEINTRGKGEYVDAAFDRNEKAVYYQARSYLDTEDGTRTYSEATKPIAALYREELILERDVTFMYDGTSRTVHAFYGWGEVSDTVWKSEDEAVATVGQDGTIHAIATGETVLTCSSPSLEKEATTKVVVNRKSLAPLMTGKRRYAFNEETGHWENKPADKTDDAVIMMVGDMMCGSAQTKKQYTPENGFRYNDSYKFVKKVTAASDFAVGNLETLLAPGWPYMIDETYINNQNNCNNPSRYLDAVLSGGFDAVTLSNNHNCDGGTRALLETIDEVNLRKIPFTGIFRNAEDTRFMIININGIKVGFLAYMSKYTGFNGKEKTWTQEERDTLLNVFSKETAETDIKNCKAAGAEYIIAYMHWGKKNYKQITPEQELEAQEAADAGADYIVGANPHMVQIYDELTSADGRTVPCFYSTGNFQAFMNQITGNRDSVMVRIRLKRNEEGKIVLEENNYIPYHTFTEKNGCNWTPLAISEIFNRKLKIPGRKRHAERIMAAIGSKIEVCTRENIYLEPETKEESMEFVTQYTIQQVCDILEVELPEAYQNVANNTLTNIAPIVNSLAIGGAFILSGKNKENREEQLVKALKRKPQLVIAGRASRNLEQLQTVPHIFVKDPYDAMVKLCSNIRNTLGLTVVGVTGSLGKTTTKEMVHAVLSQSYVADKNFGNRNNTKGIFNSLQSVSKDVQFYVQEFGVAIGQKSMESKVNSCLPNAAVITNISDPHLDVFGTRENILKEKIKLVTEMPEGSPAFFNYDDALLKEVKLEKHPIVSFAVENPEADYHAENIQFIDDYITFDAVHGDRRTPVVLHSREKHNIGNALVAMAVGEWFKMPLDKIVEGIDSFRSEGIRQSLTNIGGYQVYVDCYNTAPVSLLGAIDVLERLPVEAGGKRIAVLGDIVRLGTEEERLHREVGEKIGRSTLDLVLCFGNYNAKLMAETIRKEGKAALYTDTREVLDEWMRWLITKKDVTLVKGPVARLLSKSIDQVFGTSYHVRSEHHDSSRQGDYQIDIIFEKEDHSKCTGALLEYRGKDAVHTVPSSHNGVDFFCVYVNCFKGNKVLEEVTIPEPIYNISEGAFQSCTNLNKVSLPATLKVIGDNAFAGCKALTALVIPEGTIDIGVEAFKSCAKLEQITIPSTIGHIGENAFAGCSKVQIHCDADSYAQKYAVENGLTVVLNNK